MDLQKEFSHAAFGGFKKEEVLQYLDEIEKRHEEEIAECQAKLYSLDSQLAELNGIVEQQYQKIVDASKEAAELKAALNEKAREASELARRLAPYEHSRQEAEAYLKEASEKADQIRREALAKKEQLSAETEAHLQEIRQEADRLLDKASEKGKVILGEANEQAKKLVSAAQDDADRKLREAEEEAAKVTIQAKQLFETTKSKAQELLDSAKKKERELLDNAKDQIEQNISLSEENEARSQKLVEDAQKEAEDILRRARFAASQKQEYYEGCLQRLESQKADIILSLDAIKLKIESIEISKTKKSGLPPEEQRRLNAEALRQKFTLLNNKER